MPQINLLKQKQYGQSFFDMLPSVLLKVFLLGLAVLLGYYAWLFVNDKKIQKDIQSSQQTIAEQKRAGAENPDRDELLARQEQTAELKNLVEAHYYWSKVFPELAKATLKQAKYSSLRVDPKGNLDLVVTVPNLEELDKFLLVFDKPKFYSNFSEVKIGSYREVQNEQKQKVINLDIKMKFNVNLLNINSPKAIN